MEEYFQAQGRFKHLCREDLEHIQAQVDHDRERLKSIARLG